MGSEAADGLRSLIARLLASGRDYLSTEFRNQAKKHQASTLALQITHIGPGVTSGSRRQSWCAIVLGHGAGLLNTVEPYDFGWLLIKAQLLDEVELIRMVVAMVTPRPWWWQIFPAKMSLDHLNPALEAGKHSLFCFPGGRPKMPQDSEPLYQTSHVLQCCQPH